MTDKFLTSERAKVFAVIALGPILLIGPMLLGGRSLFWGTPGLQFIPWWAEAWRQIQTGVLPFWNSLNGMGAPLMANYQAAFFYPPNWILFLFAMIRGIEGIAWGYTFLAMLHLIWAGWGMAVLLRRLGVGMLAQMIGGLAFALSGYLVARLGFFSMIWVAAWIPWIIRYADEISNPAGEQKRLVIQPILIFCLGMQYLAGHAQLAWYSTILMCGWVIAGCLSRKNSTRMGWALASLAITGAAAGLIAAVQLLPTAEYLSQSQRATEYGYKDAMVYSFWPWRLITLAAPDFFGNPGRGSYWGYGTFWEDAAYIGMLPLIFAFSTLGWLFGKKTRAPDQSNRGFVGAMWALIGTSVLLACGSNTPVFPFLYFSVPTFNLFQAPARYLIWAVFGLCILAGLGSDQWKSPNRKQQNTVRIYTIAALAVMIGAGTATIFAKNIQGTFISATAMAGFWAAGVGVMTLLLARAERNHWKGWWFAWAVGWVLADLLVANYALNPSVSLDFYSARSEAKSNLVKMVGSSRVYLAAKDESSLKFKRFLNVQDYSIREDWKEIRTVLLPNTNLLDPVGMANNFDPFVPGRYEEWINMLEAAGPAEQRNMFQWMDVKVVEHIDKTLPDGVRFDTIDETIKYAWFSCIRSVTDGAAALEAMKKPQADTLVIEEADVETGGICVKDHALPGSVQSEGSDAIRFAVDAKSDGWMYLANTWYPGWNAALDGTPVQLYRANYLFQAVFVPQGKHTISIKYQSKSFYIGALFSILILVAAICIWAAKRILQKRPD